MNHFAFSGGSLLTPVRCLLTHFSDEYLTVLSFRWRGSRDSRGNRIDPEKPEEIISSRPFQLGRSAWQRIFNQTRIKGAADILVHRETKRETGRERGFESCRILCILSVLMTDFLGHPPFRIHLVSPVYEETGRSVLSSGSMSWCAIAESRTNRGKAADRIMSHGLARRTYFGRDSFSRFDRDRERSQIARTIFYGDRSLPFEGARTERRPMGLHGAKAYWFPSSFSAGIIFLGRAWILGTSNRFWSSDFEN